MKNILRWKRSVLFTWLVSYLSFLILFTAISIITYVNTKKVIYEEVHRSNALLLTRVRNSMDNVLRESKLLSAQIMFNPRVQQLINIRGSLTDAQYYEISKASNDLKNFIFSNSSIDSVYLFLKGIGMVVTPAYNTDISTFFNMNFTPNDNLYNTWIKEFDEKTLDKFFVSSNNQISYVHSLSQTFPNDLQSSVVVSIDKESFLEEVEGLDNINEGITFILNEKNQILASSEQISQVPALSYNKLTGKNGTLNLVLSNKKMVASYISSEVSDWKYITIIPEEIFLRKVTHAKNVSLRWILISLLIAGCLICFFLMRNYNPLYKLLSLFNNEIVSNSESDANEYLFIEKAINKTLNDKKLIKEQLHNQKLLLKSSLLARVMKGQAQDILPVHEAFHSYNINFDTNYFSVILLFIEEYDKNFNYICCDEGKSFNIANFAISNVIEEMISIYHKGYIVNVDGTLACLVNLKADRLNQSKDDLLKICEEAQQFIYEHFHINLSLSMSTVYENVENIHVAFREAMDTMNYKKILGLKRTLCYDDLEDLTQKDYYYPLNIEQQLVNFIKAGDYSNSKAIMDEIFEKNFERKSLTAQLAQCLMLNLASTMIKTVNEVSSISEGNFLSALNPMEKLLPCKTVEEMKLQIDNFLKSFCDYMNKANNQSSNWVVSDVVPYIQTYYNNPDLTVSTIAEHFGVHPVYMSRAYKEQIGDGLLDYINKVRIKNSKRILKEKLETNLSDIAVEVGFTNVRTFSRVFKKYEGITPGKFRELLV